MFSDIFTLLAEVLIFCLDKLYQLLTIKWNIQTTSNSYTVQVVDDPSIYKEPIVSLTGYDALKIIDEGMPGCNMVHAILTKTAFAFPTAKAYETMLTSTISSSNYPSEGTNENVITQTYEDMHKTVDHIGHCLHSLGINSCDKVFLYSDNQQESLMVVLSCLRYGHPLFVLDKEVAMVDAIHYICQSEAKVLITSDVSIVNMWERPSMTHINIIVSTTTHVHGRNDHNPNHVFSVAEGKLFIQFCDLQKMGEVSKFVSISLPRLSDVALIYFTSGSESGLPRGVTYTHDNLRHSFAGHRKALEHLLFEGVTYLSYLPISNIFELQCQLACISRGVRIIYSNLQQIVQGSAAILNTSTFMHASPGVFEPLYRKTMTLVQSRGSGYEALYQFAFNFSVQQHRMGHRTPFTDWCVFKKIAQQTVFGDHLRCVLVSGGALSDFTAAYVRTCLCGGRSRSVCHVYTVTEAAGGVTLCDGHCCRWHGSQLRRDTTDHGGTRAGCVGLPLPHIRLGLRSFAGFKEPVYTFQRGEVLTGGRSISSGYYSDAVGTSEAFDDCSDGTRWVATGDLGGLCTEQHCRLRLFGVTVRRHTASEDARIRRLFGCGRMAGWAETLARAANVPSSKAPIEAPQTKITTSATTAKTSPVRQIVAFRDADANYSVALIMGWSVGDRDSAAAVPGACRTKTVVMSRATVDALLGKLARRRADAEAQVVTAHTVFDDPEARQALLLVMFSKLIAEGYDIENATFHYLGASQSFEDGLSAAFNYYNSKAN